MPSKSENNPLAPVRTRTRLAPKSVLAIEKAPQLEAAKVQEQSKRPTDCPPARGATGVVTPETVRYKIGYGKPPRDYQFKKGQSGNPKGRPKQAQSLNTIVRKRMHETVQLRTADGIKRVTRIDALFMKTLEQGAKGDPRALAKLFSLYAAAVPEPREEEQTPSSVDPSDISLADEAILQRFRARVIAEVTAEGERPLIVPASDKEDKDA